MPYLDIQDKRAWGREYARKWRVRNAKRASASVLRTRDPLKHRARAAVAYAKKTGKLKSQPCEVCGKSQVQAHHEDYNKPLEVRWLCAIHHAEADKA